MRVVVTGAGGQLGAVLLAEFRTAHDVAGLTRRELDIADDAAVAATMDRIQPQLIVNAAAFTDVDASEERPIDALNANAFGVRALARAAERHGATLVHYSTDFVFDGTASRPYTEADAPNPRSTYAMSKLLGEWFALDASRTYVLRVESLFGGVAGGPKPRGSVASIFNTLLAGGSPKVFVDRTVSPTYAIDAAGATRQLVESGAPFGIYHCVNTGATTWFDFARELARQLGIEPRLTPVRMSEVALKAVRPQYCALSNEKLRSVGIEMPPWQEAVGRSLQPLRREVANQLTDRQT
jgi:dTDP-4-dehydrorhamnose reductase